MGDGVEGSAEVQYSDIDLGLPVVGHDEVIKRQ